MMLDVDWNWLPGEDHGNPAWKLDRVLYALVAPETHEVVYIGKSWGPVRRRWLAKDKEGLWKHLEQKLGMNKHGFVVGIVDPQKRYTLTTKLLQDIEGLLIYEVKPPGNVQGRDSRGTCRPGMVVRCTGALAWPHPRRKFVDNGQGVT